MKVKFSTKGYPIFSKKRGQVKEIEKITEMYKCTFSNNITQYYDIKGKNGFGDKLYCEIPIEISFVPSLFRILIGLFLTICLGYLMFEQTDWMRLSCMFLYAYVIITTTKYVMDINLNRIKYRNLNHYKRINIINKK